MKWFVVPLLAMASLPFLSAAPRPRAEEPGAANHCVEIGAASMWGGIGWTHLVYVTNIYCAQDLVCVVTTNEDPDPQTTRAPPNVTVQVVTALNHEAKWFVPIVICNYFPEPQCSGCVATQTRPAS